MKTVRAGALAVLLASSSSAGAQRAPARAVRVDDGYILALSAADQFLHAWVNRDAVEGRATLTPAAVARVPADQLTTYFQGVSSPHHESFEIGPGHKMSPTSYSFDVIQY